MPKAYFIGGTPRVGKTTLSVSIVKKHPMRGASTDALRSVLQNIISAEQAPALFALQASRLSEDELIKRIAGDPNRAIRYQVEESTIVWKSVKDFVESNLEDGFDVLVEGVAILPGYVSQLGINYSAVFLGDTSKEHTKTTLESAENNAYDWLNQQSQAVAEAFCTFDRTFSKYIESECRKYDQPYIEVDDSDFERSMDHAANILLKA